MNKRAIALLAGASLVMAFALGGCFSSPTNPHEGVFTSVNSYNTGGHNTPGVPTRVPTGVPTVGVTPTPGTGGSGTISGTVTGTGGNLVEITAVGVGGATLISTSRTGDGAYTITGIPNGAYGVTADTLGAPYLTGSYSGTTPPPPLVISGATSYSGIDIVMH